MKILHNCLKNHNKNYAVWRYMFVVLLVFATHAQTTAQTMMPLPNFGNTYSGSVRGYWFTAPTSFIITGVRVPADAGPGTQNIHIMKINDATPVTYATSSTNFTTLSYIQGAPNNVIQSVNILVNQGDIIGILGQAGTSNSYSVTGGPYPSTILGQSLTLNRLIYQGNITAGPAPNYSWEPGSGAISRVEMYYTSPAPCTGTPSGGTAIAPSLACGAFGLSLSGSTPAAGITYQWLSAPTATGPWTPIAGATSPNETITQTASTHYKCEVTCSNSSLLDSSTAIFVQSPPMIAPFYEGFNNASQPQCWDNLSADPSTSVNNFWNFNDQGDYAAANNGRNAGEFVKVDGNSPYGDSVMLITPQIDISQLATPYLSFEWFSNNTNNPGDNVPLIIEVYDGTSWTLLDTLRGDSPDWEFVNYDLSPFIGNIIQVRFMVNKTLTTSFSYYNDILLDDVRIDDCISLGGVDGSFDICRLDSNVNLNDNIIVKPNGGGEWSFPSQQSFISQDSILGVTYLPAGSYEIFYVERYVCYDTTTATINVFKPSSAGFDGADTVCKNEPINLFGALTGNVDTSGDWFDFTNTMLPNSQPKAEPIPGNYNYFYVANNGVCPADSSIVTIKVLDTCDFLSLGEELFTDISVYPNPATSQLNIVNPSSAAALRVEMFDMNGRTVLIENKALNNASEATLAIDHLEKGIYTLRVYNSDGQKTFKIVKQ
ncbi:T9SS type A sorting domain-containing protein [Brumimicrobium glaciale]|uniref:T9SS type A sorting domain-containing protein n=1 Tax=Brumimicrobium glaciale TaxID=200475 RepID=A0A4Q4KKD0_9FLAO|nr:T9SS type A sorting domain-containing protein [Brumimicrobium glaciale]RYM33813.1 T9SS type A sorting domain-containing protein [Brumimicrobium glaciale]